MSTIILKSATHANKAKSYLAKVKIKAVVVKVPSKSGCSFGIKVWDNPQKICRLLALENIECVKIIVGDDA